MFIALAAGNVAHFLANQSDIADNRLQRILNAMRSRGELMLMRFSRRQIPHHPTQFAGQGLQQKQLDRRISSGARMAEHQKPEGGARGRSQRRDHRAAESEPDAGILPGHRGAGACQGLEATARKVLRQLAKSSLGHTDFNEAFFAHAQYAETKINGEIAPETR